MYYIGIDLGTSAIKLLLMEGNGISAWSLSVGEPNGRLPSISALATTG